MVPQAVSQYHQIRRSSKECGIHNGIEIYQDGNRRYAKKLKMEGFKGHSFGREALARILEWSHYLGIKEVSLYALSVDNLKRPQEELQILFSLFKDTFTKALEHESFFMKNRVRVKFLGQLNLLPIDVQECITILENKTKEFTNLKVNICLAYSSTEEFNDCIKNMKKKGVTEATASTIEENLYGGCLVKPDMIIRTSGEIRLSNFFLYQGKSSIILFLKTLWPEFSIWDMYRVISAYHAHYKT